MTSSMYAVLVLSALAAAALSAGCGKKDEQNGSGTTDEARIHLGCGLAAGDGVRLTMELKGTTSLSDREGNVSIEGNVTTRLSMTQRCVRRTKDGGSVITLVMESFEMEGVPAELASLEFDQLKNMTGTMTLGADGNTEAVNFEGLEASVEDQLRSTLNCGGFLSTYPSRPEGLQVGDVIPIEDFEPVGQFSVGPAGGMPAGIDAKFVRTGEGGHTLVAVRMVAGEAVAEFAIDTRTVWSGDMGGGGSFEMHFVSTGTRFVSVATGMLIGESTLEQSSTSSMKLDGQAQPIGDTTGTIRVTTRAEPLK